MDLIASVRANWSGKLPENYPGRELYLQVLESPNPFDALFAEYVRLSTGFNAGTIGEMEYKTHLTVLKVITDLVFQFLAFNYELMGSNLASSVMVVDSLKR